MIRSRSLGIEHHPCTAHVNVMSQSDDWLDSHDETLDHDDMEREWNSRRREFHVNGMRDGYEAGKEETVQEGFDQGMLFYLHFSREMVRLHS